ncbi:MAG TPA: sulfite exporter TauE/SafE family protein [Spirochaetes bacterium]|nr:sulfite exporter TauE/SafE family protein [Spirochaetota bacterium]
MYILAVLIGLSAGALGGLIGIGGGVLIIPLLTMVLKFDQHLAQGTSLAAMVPPIGILAAYMYYRAGHVNIPVALCIALGFLVGGFLGAKVAVLANEVLLQKLFGVALLLIAVKMIFF